MRPSILVCRSFLFSAIVLALPACAADLYKWVDEHGVTNYSSEPPANAKAAKFNVAENRVSVYTPDRLLLQAMEASRQKMIDDVRTGRTQRQIDAEYLARLRTPPSLPSMVSGYDPCLDAANVDLCNSRIYSDLPYGAAPFGVAGRGSRFLPQAQLTPGTAAGEVVGINGIMPGNSAFTPGTMMPVTPTVPSSRVPSGKTGHPGGGGHRR
jgi:uncharacterized protein DUF4124